MAEPFLPTPFAEKLVAELRALHERRERAPLDDREEARYAELWAWWQERSGGADLADPEVAGGHAAAAGADVPAEWHPFADQPVGDTALDDAADDEDALVREWEAWQGRRPPEDPFSTVPGMEVGEDDAPTHEQIMAARAEALGVDATPDDLNDTGAEDGVADGAALPELDVEVEGELSSEAEEAPPPAPAGAAAPAAQRVVIHLNDGQVRRGQLSYPRLDVDVFGYVTQGGAEETVPRAEVRAIFFMRSPGDPPPQPIGSAVRVSFRDGRELAGFSEDHDRISDAFTLVPSDARTNASLVWIARSAVRQVTAS